MDIRAEKLRLIEYLLKIQDEMLLYRIKIFIENASKADPEGKPAPMSLESFYERIEASEQALQKGDIITQDELREEIKTWKKA